MADKLNISLVSALESIKKLREGLKGSGCLVDSLEPQGTWTRPSSCDLCEGSGYILEDAGSVWTASTCPECVDSCGRCGAQRQVWWEDDRGYEFCGDCPECVPLYRVVKHVCQAGIPSQYVMREVYPLTEEQREVMLVLMEWLKSFTRNAPGFMLCGPVGVGKTQLAVTVLRHMIERRMGRSFLFLQVRELLSRLQDGVKSRDPQALLRMACRVDVLVLDELKPVRTEWQAEMIEEVITRRYQSNKTTIGTTNLEDDKLDTMMVEAGERIASRIMEWMPPVEMGGPDLRKEDT